MLSKNLTILLCLFFISIYSCQSQTTAKKPLTGMSAKALTFLQSLSEKQKSETQFSFEDDERYNWHFIPKTRKGITLNELNAAQKKAAMELLHTALSDTAYNKTMAIMELEKVLKAVENRPDTDAYRDPGNYHFSIFGDPADTIWGWRLEGHHVSFNFSTKDNRLVSGTPGFMGSNPAIVLSGPEKGKEILKDETDLGLAMVRSLNADQLSKAMISTTAPGDIITSNNRKAMINDPKGVLYKELNAAQQKMFMQLLSLYIHRYTRLFANEMMKQIEGARLNELRFAWAGEQEKGPGHPHYYRIQGPTIIIEYDNTQNNANHVHTVVRDLTNDFGGDELLEHYKTHRHHQ